MKVSKLEQRDKLDDSQLKSHNQKSSCYSSIVLNASFNDLKTLKAIPTPAP